MWPGAVRGSFPHSENPVYQGLVNPKSRLGLKRKFLACRWSTLEQTVSGCHDAIALCRRTAILYHVHIAGGQNLAKGWQCSLRRDSDATLQVMEARVGTQGIVDWLREAF
jgi:hypothetical protein